jgi:putative methionine-R-sulfoxide reductase with GAF domain
VAEILHELTDILAENIDRTAKAVRIVQALRAAGHYRWVGIYDVDLQSGTVSNVAWDGPNAPAFPTFRSSEGLTSRTIAEKKTVNVGNVAAAPQYLVALHSTRSEIIVPVMNERNETVVGTIDVESEKLNAFDSKAQSFLEECATVLRPFWAVSS